MTLLLTDRGPFRWLIWPEAGEADAFSITLTGLSTDSLGNYGAVGDHASIGYTIDPDNATETVKWSNSSNPADAATYGTGAAPTDFTASDDSTVYLHVTDGGETVTRSFAVRYAPGTAPAVADGQSWTVDDTVINIDASASGSNLTFSYSSPDIPDNGTLALNPTTGAITGTTTSVDSGTITIVATDQYGRTLQDTFTYTSALRSQATAANGLSDPDWTVDDDTVNLDTTSDFTANGNSLDYVITGLPTGLVDDGDGTISGTPTVDGQSGTITVTATDEYGRETVSTFTFTTAYRSQATASGAITTQVFEDDTGDQTYDPTGDFTVNGNTPTYSVSSISGVSINSSTGLLTFDTDAMSLQSGTPITVTLTDEYSRTTDTDFDFDISEAGSPVNPSSTGDTFTAASGGTPASFDAEGTYAGSDQINITMAFGNSISITDSQLIAESGGTGVDGFVTKTNITVTDGDFAFSENIDDGDFTYPSGKDATDVEGSDQIKYIVWEANNGGKTAVITAGDTPVMDLTPVAFSSAAVLDVNTIRVTLSENAYGSTAHTEWALTGNTITADDFTPGNDYVDLTVGTPITPSDDYTGDLAFSGSSLTDIGGLVLATFSGEDVTNGLEALVLDSSSPTDNATDVAITTVIDLVFDKTVVLGTGNIVLRDNDGGFADLETFNVATGTGDGGGTVALATTSVTNDTVRITPGSSLANEIEHAIRVAATCIDDTFGISYAGITDDTTLSFTTVAAATNPTVSGSTGSPATGTFDDSGTNKRYYDFTGSGTLTFDNGGDIEILIVPGGGGGGDNYGNTCGGGGAGGLPVVITPTVSAGTLTITVGAAGTGGSSSVGGNGGDSSVSGIATGSATGGKGGGYWNGADGDGVNGELGSGASGPGTGGTGSSFNGGSGNAGSSLNNAGGGGAGAGAAGEDGGTDTSDSGGDGGEGVAYNYNGTSIVFGSGGGGPTASSISGREGTGGTNAGDGAIRNGTPTAGTANTGSGGGGSPRGGPGGAAGGSGRVIVKFAEAA